MTTTQTPYKVAVLIHDVPFRQKVNAALLESGLRVLQATNDQDILEFCNAQTVDLVVLDTISLRLARAVRAEHDRHDMPILVFLQQGDVAHIDAAFDAGATDCLLFPLPHRLLLRRLAQHIDDLRAREQQTLMGRLTTFHDNAPVMMYSINHDGVVRYANRTLLDALGYPPEQVIGKPYLTFVDPALRGDTQRAVENFWAVGKFRNRANRFVRADGGFMDVVIDSNLVEDPIEGKISVSVVRDVTAQRQMEVTLASSDRQRQGIIRAMHDAVYVLDRNGLYVDIPSLESPHVPSYAAGLLGKTLHQTLPRSRADFLLNHILRVLETGETLKIEFDVMIEGVQTWFNTAISPLNETQIVAVARDVTESKKREAHMRESERLYRNLFESATDCIMLVSLESGDILEANASASKLLGYAPDELTQLNIRDIEVSVTNSTETLTLDLDTDEQLLFEQMYRCKDGTLVPIESHSRIIRYHNQAAVLNFARDITHRKRILEGERALRLLAEAFRDSAAAFNQATTSDEVLDAMIAHINRVVPSATANVMLYDPSTDRAQLTRWRGYDNFGFTDEEMSGISFVVSETENLRTMRATREPIDMGDVQSNPDWQEVVTTRWIRSYVGAPIFLKDELIGFLSLDSDQPNAFDPEKLGHLQAFANQAAIAFANVRLLAQLREQNVVLEERVQERTQALSEVNAALSALVDELRQTQASLQQERQMLQLIMDNITDMIYVKDTAGSYTLVNRATLVALGAKSVEDVRGRTVVNFFDVNYANLHNQIDRRILETGNSVVNMDNVMMFADGTQHRQLLSKFPLRDAEGRIIGIVGINRDVTELKRIEARLDSEREQLKQVLMSARCLLWTARMEQRGDTFHWSPTVVNEDTAQLLLPLNTATMSYAEAWQASIVPEDRERRNYVLQTHIQFNRRNFSQELRCRRSDGSLLWLVEDVQVRRVGDHEWELVGICTDITERKRAEANLQQAYLELEHRIEERTAELVKANAVLTQEIAERKRAEEAERKQRILAEALSQSVAALNRTSDSDALLDYLLETMGDIVPHDSASIMLLEADGATATVVRETGYGKQEVGIKHDISNYPDKQYIIAHGKPFIIEDTTTFIGWSGHEPYQWVRSQLSVPIRIDESVIGFLNADSKTPRHFTQQHADWLMAFADQAALAIRNARMLTQIREYNAVLERSVESRTAQLRAILDAMRDGLIYHNLQGKTQYFNHALVEISGYSANEWWAYDPHTHNILVTKDDEDRERLFARWSKLLETHDYYEDDVTLRRADGSTFPARIVRAVVRDGNGDKMGTLTLVRDISQAKQLEAQKARFIANASHELRTPIANMKTRLFLMRRQPERFEEHVAIAEEVARYMQHLIEDMFDLARFERGSIEPHTETLEVQALINAIVQFQQPEAERKGISLQIDVAPDVTEITIDPYRFMQVVTNLVTNAINYTPQDGTVRLTLHRETRADRRAQLVMSVSDTGTGISEEHQKQLFTPFFRAADDNKGAGLGLAISQEIVQLHGGTIEVQSELGKGSTFIVRIPT
jgi:PAS domain S-box-containing protein